MTEDEKIEARYKLVQSAKLAYRSGVNQVEWMYSEAVRKYIEESGLDDTILDHIASWVWTFRKV